MSLSDDDMRWAQDHLRILSGLYGVLRPLDQIQAYRLEMGSRLKTERGGSLVACTRTSPNYALYALPDGKRPALVKLNTPGSAIEVEVWRMPAAAFGSFVCGIPAPLGIGKVELEDGSELPGFICDGYGLEGAKDVSNFGSWRNWLSEKAAS